MNFLSNSVQKIIDKIGNKKYIKQEDIDNIMQEINPALLKADVDYEVVIKFNELIKQQTLNMKTKKVNNFDTWFNLKLIRHQTGLSRTINLDYFVGCETSYF
ncbi:MAG: signal recognition particle receptor subunit alpha, partial [Candidatus Phytoplasma australasiaticum]|nr:signal recognition particle receptor subunit alpha [Candidatus Phytoplasma australasiaticum]